MKYLFLAFFSISFLFACIKPNQDNPNSGTTPATPTPSNEGISVTTTVIDTMTGRPMLAEKPISALSTAIGDNPVKVVDPKEPVKFTIDPKTPQEERVVRVLTTELWAVWSLIRIKKVPETRMNQGAWFKFNIDGTYEYGYWDEPISTGTWYFDGQAGQINLDSKLKGDDRQWKVQMGSSEEVMVWVGTEKYTTTDISLKLERFHNVPQTRAELGVRE